MSSTCSVSTSQSCTGLSRNAVQAALDGHQPPRPAGWHRQSDPWPHSPFRGISTPRPTYPLPAPPIHSTYTFAASCETSPGGQIARPARSTAGRPSVSLIKRRHAGQTGASSGPLTALFMRLPVTAPPHPHPPPSPWTMEATPTAVHCPPPP